MTASKGSGNAPPEEEKSKVPAAEPQEPAGETPVEEYLEESEEEEYSEEDYYSSDEEQEEEYEEEEYEGDYEEEYQEEDYVEEPPPRPESAFEKFAKKKGFLGLTPLDLFFVILGLVVGMKACGKS
jgi:hypothetical protein